MQKKPELLTFDRFAEIVSPEGKSIPNVLSMSHDFMVGVDILKFGHRFIPMNLLLQVQDYRIGYVRSGQLKVRINLIDKVLTQNTLVFLIPGSILQPLESSEDFSLCGMVLSTEFLHVVTGGRLPSFLDGKQMDGQLSVPEEECNLLYRCFQLLLQLIQKDMPNQQGQSAMISVVLSEYELMFSSQQQTHHYSQCTHEQSVFERFIYLVNKNSRQEHKLSFYADKMCLSERYLGSIIKKASGVTSKEWIDRSLITAAKVLLKHSDKTSAEIADELNFPNASFFAKYFKRLTDITPMEFRRK